MKDPRNVLREKERDLARVRREIQAVLTVIPLLADDQPSSDVVHEVLLAFFPNTSGSSGRGSNWRSTFASSGTCDCSNPRSGDRPRGPRV